MMYYIPQGWATYRYINDMKLCIVLYCDVSVVFSWFKGFITEKGCEVIF